MDETRRVFRLRAGERLAAGPAVAEARAKALDLGALAGAAQLLGAGRALLDASARYAGYREQFGHPIGQFQAVKHRLADVAIGLEFARPLLYAAAVAVAGDTSTAGRDISAAKVACATAADRAARAALQVHGAIGYAVEGGIAAHLTKIRALIPAWGTPSAHRARVMAALADGLVS
jgi:alkylation response protein AidB-like acyl-CoA dehydrogenase